jgi:hypothetical protein
MFMNGKCSIEGFGNRQSWPILGSCANSHLEILRITAEIMVRNSGLAEYKT